MQTTTHLEATPKAAPTQPDHYNVSMPALWDQKTLAAYLGKSTAWCERARWCGEGPKFIKLGRHVRYKADDVLAWIDESSQSRSGSEG
ncbi:helix-turn-helix transcriptional regulator [Saccharospirillum sp.]|uniref:helix-turn-helix transcriptional regulator n=1 Tax=Saccharospirillum sp. TaxID=2033801 RepID=UPI00349FE95C